MSLREIRTATEGTSIWHGLPEEKFRQHLVTLEERTNTIPMDPTVFSSADWALEFQSENTYTFPLEVEQQVADDFACLVAVAEGAQSVAAMCIEECRGKNGAIFRFAAMDMSLDESVKSALQDAVNILAEAASSSERQDTARDCYIERLYDVIMRLHELRLLARLRSEKWKKPKYLSKSHKKPLWQDFANLGHRAQFAYTKQEKSIRQSIESQIDELSIVYKDFETSQDNLTSLKTLVDASLAFCMKTDIKDYLRRLQNQTKQTAQIAAATKSLRQIQKIAAHRRMSIYLVETAQRYPTLFCNIKIEYLTPYKSVPTPIGYHEWAKTCHVHAEVQLAVYYDLNPEYRARAIGTSKWLCYLCYQFLHAHKLFFPSKTHGQLYDQWTIPDLAEYSEETVKKYRGIVRQMDDAVVEQIEHEPELSRLKPMTSCTLD